MEFRMTQLREAVSLDKAKRRAKVQALIDEIERDADEMCRAERLYREGKLPKRICHCDTKVSNMLFDAEGKVLCIIDLDTVMPSFVFSDFGDFLRTAACTAPEDEPDVAKVHFNMDIFRAFAKGYLESAMSFLTPLEIEMLPYAVRLFPYMQAVRFLTDYLNGDSYYQIQYAEHNYVRTLAQYRLYQEVCKAEPEMCEFIKTQINADFRK
jgi:Ser/Thr protein kinase RdoA (MazF antagonist)